MDRYIGLDAHASSCTVATMGPSGRRLHSQVIETNAGALIQVLRSIPRNRHLCLEEGTHASWLYEVLSPHVEEIVVAAVRQSRGPKSDKVDAFGLAEQLRTGSLRLPRGCAGVWLTLWIQDGHRSSRRLSQTRRPIWPIRGPARLSSQTQAPPLLGEDTGEKTWSLSSGFAEASWIRALTRAPRSSTSGGGSSDHSVRNTFTTSSSGTGNMTPMTALPPISRPFETAMKAMWQLDIT